MHVSPLLARNKLPLHTTRIAPLLQEEEKDIMIKANPGHVPTSEVGLTQTGECKLHASLQVQLRSRQSRATCPVNLATASVGMPSF